MAAFDRDALQDFVKGGDKSAPPVFVGREKVIDDIESTVMLAWGDDGAHGEPGLTRIVQGAPGAGKSAILAELARRSTDRSQAPGQPRVLVLSGDDLVTDLPLVLRAIAIAGSATGRKWRGMETRLSLGVSAIVHASGEMSWPADEAPSSLPSLAVRFPAATWQGPVIVAVDEAQALPGNRTMPHALFLRGIHNASSGLPLTLVLAGLGDTRDRASEMDLTRGTEIHSVGGLDGSDVTMLMNRSCRRFGLGPEGHEAQLEALAAPAEGWPRHLHHALQALGRAALDADGDLDSIDWCRTEAEFAESRIQYYGNQQDEIMRGARELVAKVMMIAPGADTSEGADRNAIMDAIERNVQDRPGHRLPEGMDSVRFLRHLVHRGALQRHNGILDTFHCPIPSFRRHLVRAGGLESELEPVRGTGSGPESCGP